MGKISTHIDKSFVAKEREDGKEVEVIYKPPLLAKSENIRVELRKEKNHASPHVHILKKGKTSSHELSLSLNDMDILAGRENLKYFDRKELRAIVEFIAENLEEFQKLYQRLRGEI